MSGRWTILALLFAVRTAMAFQFQSVAALAPLIRRDFGVDLADVGLLIGLYLSPGIVLALPGGAIGKRYGDKASVVAGLALMACGGLIMALSPSWAVQLFGRVLAGVGGVLLNVLMAKMVTDWFSGREIATAMAIFVNSWPVGIALALVLLPPIAIHAGVSAAFLLTSVLIIIGMVAIALLYRPAPAFRETIASNGAAPKGNVFLAVMTAGLIWGLFNASVGMIFSFAPSLLDERGWTVASASSVTSVVLWVAAFSVPFGGYLADRTGHHRLVMLGGLVAFGAMLIIAARTDAVLPAFIVVGLVSGLSAGPIMSLPNRVLAPEARAVGMGVFYALFYLVVVVGAWVGGVAASFAGTARVTFDLGAVMLGACCVAWLVFEKLAARADAQKHAQSAEFIPT